MSTQTEVAQIIQHMDENYSEDWDGRRIRAELRRLHEVNQELLEALKINLEVLEKVDPYKGQEDLLVDVVSMNKELIAKATGEQA